MSHFHTPKSNLSKTVRSKNGEFIESHEKDVEGRWSVFFFLPGRFFYPFLFARLNCDAADHYEEPQKLGVDVYSVSATDTITHAQSTAHSSSETIAQNQICMITPDWRPRPVTSEYA